MAGLSLGLPRTGSPCSSGKSHLYKIGQLSKTARQQTLSQAKHTTGEFCFVHQQLNVGIEIGHEQLLACTSVVTGTNSSVGFRLLGHNRNPNRPKFLKPELSVVINTSFLALFVEFLPFISSKTTRRTFFQLKIRHFV